MRNVILQIIIDESTDVRFCSLTDEQFAFMEANKGQVTEGSAFIEAVVPFDVYNLPTITVPFTGTVDAMYHMCI